MDRLAEVDARFKLENFVDKVLAADIEHPNTDLFNRIFDLLDVLRNDASIDSANPQINLNASNNGDLMSNAHSRRSNHLARIPT